MEIFRWLGSWLLVGYWVDRHLTQMYLGKGWLKLGEIHTHANHGNSRPPMAAMVPHSRHRGIQQSADMLRNRSTLLKLEKKILFTIIFTIMCTTRRQRQENLQYWPPALPIHSQPPSQMATSLFHHHWKDSSWGEGYHLLGWRGQRYQVFHPYPQNWQLAAMLQLVNKTVKERAQPTERIC